MSINFKLIIFLLNISFLIIIFLLFIIIIVILINNYKHQIIFPILIKKMA